MKHALRMYAPGPLVTALFVALVAPTAACVSQADTATAPTPEQPFGPATLPATDPFAVALGSDGADAPYESSESGAGLCEDLPFPAANPPDTCRRILVSRDDTGAPFEVSSIGATLAAAGNLIAFTVLPSKEPGVNGLPEDTNVYRDVYAVDTRMDRISPLELISVDDKGEAANGESFGASLSDDGRYVAFTSYATNLTAQPTAGFAAIYVRDRIARRTQVVSLPNKAGPIPNGDSYSPRISADGRYVLFLSAATNLVENDGNGRVDLFLRDRLLGTTERISLDEKGREANADAQPAAEISRDGRYVLFAHPSRLTAEAQPAPGASETARTEIYRLDRRTGALRLISRREGGDSVRGAWLVSATPSGDRALMYVMRRESLFGETGLRGPGTVLASIAPDGVTFERVKLAGGIPTGMSADTGIVSFTSNRPGHVDHVQMLADDLSTDNAYVADRDLGETLLLTAADNGVPALIHEYDEPGVRELDFVTVDVDAKGSRFVVTSIQYGLTSHPALHCKRFRPRLVYFVTCNPADY